MLEIVKEISTPADSFISTAKLRSPLLRGRLSREHALTTELQRIGNSDKSIVMFHRTPLIITSSTHWSNITGDTGKCTSFIVWKTLSHEFEYIGSAISS
jgi:hypothetical protein